MSTPAMTLGRHPVGDLRMALSMVSRQGTEIYWLGQAGFLIRAGDRMLAIDPYLSDSLADKYRGSETPHERLMPAPISPDELGELDLVLVTHGHTDHMDPATLGPLFATIEHCRAIVPAAERDRAIDRGVPPQRLTGIDAGETMTVPPFKITAIAAAHETLERDAAGRHRYLGFVIEVGGSAIYHSGDCVPYPGHADALSGFPIDLALLPINGRRPELTRRGIAGNFSAAEAIKLCVDVGIPWLIGHHYGMFAFNTANLEEVRRTFAATALAGGAELAAPGLCYLVKKAAIATGPRMSADQRGQKVERPDVQAEVDQRE